MSHDESKVKRGKTTAKGTAGSFAGHDNSGPDVAELPYPPVYPAAAELGNRLGEGETYSRADFAEVGDFGIAYGVTIPAAYFAAIVLGDEAAEEADNNHTLDEEVVTAEPEFYNELRLFLEEEYGAELSDDGPLDDNVEFYVKYDEHGLEYADLAQVGGRVESETKLLAFMNGWSNGGIENPQSKFAARLGYEMVADYDSDGQFHGTWVKQGQFI